MRAACSWGSVKATTGGDEADCTGYRRRGEQSEEVGEATQRQ